MSRRADPFRGLAVRVLSDDVTGLLAAVEASPRDALPKLVLADALDDAGMPEMADALRWLATSYRTSRHPYWHKTDRLWLWFKPNAKPRYDRPHCLPREVFRAIRNRQWPNAHGSGTLWAALVAAGRAWHRAGRPAATLTGG